MKTSNIILVLLSLAVSACAGEQMTAEEAGLNQQMIEGKVPEEYKRGIALGVKLRHPMHNVTSLKIGRPTRAVIGIARYVDVAVEATPITPGLENVKECFTMQFSNGKPDHSMPGGFGSCSRNMEDITSYHKAEMARLDKL